jgi:cytochrome c oxidase cbb3-type subunit IV
MIRQTLETISGVSIYPLISFAIFFIFFMGLILYVVSIRKKYIEEVSHLPLEDQPNQNLKGGYPNA